MTPASTTKPVPKLWPGSTIVIFATGPSLCQEDVDYVRGKAPTIAINDAYRLAPWADVLYSSDNPWWKKHKGVPTFQGLKFGICPRKKQKFHFGHFPDIHALENTGSQGLEREPTGLRHGLNSGYAAINLAYHFGATRILLLGYNMSHLRGKSHFFGDHQGLSNSSSYITFLRQFPYLRDELRKEGVQVINCTDETRLHAFREAPLRDVLPEDV